MDINKAFIMGRLTDTPELKTTQSGISCASFTIAVNRKKDKNGDKKADFIDVTAFRSTAEFITKYFGKGDSIFITGEIRTDTYEDKEGKKRKSTKLLAFEAQFGESKKTDNKPQNELVELEEDEGLPF